MCWRFSSVLYCVRYAGKAQVEVLNFGAALEKAYSRPAQNKESTAVNGTCQKAITPSKKRVAVLISGTGETHLIITRGSYVSWRTLKKWNFIITIPCFKYTGISSKVMKNLFLVEFSDHVYICDAPSLLTRNHCNICVIL